jgi:hypothetical protein
MRRLEDLLSRTTDHDLAPEDLEALDLERPQVLAHKLGRHIVGCEALLLVSKIVIDTTVSSPVATTW